MFVIEIPYFNLNHIYDSGQAPRWICLSRSDEKAKYVIPYKGKALKIEQQRNKFDWTIHRFVMSCSEQDFYDIWFNYFDLSFDYREENLHIKRLGKKFKIVANRGHGIHILNQDPFEAYVLSYLITKVGYEKAFKAINHISEICGIKHVQSMREAGRITWYEFPTPQMILENVDNLKRMGNVNKWLKSECESIIKGEHSAANDLYMLFALQSRNMFPISGIENVLIKNFDCEPEEFADWYLDDIENKGLVYMYIVHHILNKPKERVSYGTY